MSDLEEALENPRFLAATWRAAALRENERFQRVVELVADREFETLKEPPGAQDAISAAIGFEAVARKERDYDLIPAAVQVALLRGQRMVFPLRALDAHMGDRSRSSRRRLPTSTRSPSTVATAPWPATDSNCLARSRSTPRSWAL